VIDEAYEDEEAQAAAAEAANIGGRPPAPLGTEEALRPVVEAGGGEAEGFEEAREELIEHASHGDQQSAHAVLHDQGRPEQEGSTAEEAEADRERSSERTAGPDAG
jgi:hypothetical protein